MSVVADQVRRLDTQLDRIPFRHLAQLHEEAASQPHHQHQLAANLDSDRVKHLLYLIKSLSTSTGSKPILTTRQLYDLLLQSKLVTDEPEALVATQYESELEWLFVSKATVGAYGLVLNTLLDQIIPLSDHVWYWDDVLSSPAGSTLFMAQTSPARLWSWSLEIYEDSKARLQEFARSGSTEAEDTEEETQPAELSLSHRWREFYGIVRESIRENSLANVQKRVMSPVALCRAEARHKQSQLKRLREMTASGFGVLLDEGLVFETSGSDDGKSDLLVSHDQEWKGVVERSVALMDMVLRDVLTLNIPVSEFEDKVFTGVQEDPELSFQVEDNDDVRPAVLAKRLHDILKSHLPKHIRSTQQLVIENGRPSRLTRYWLPATMLVLSSSTILRVLFNRKQEILGWVQDFGGTVQDFWFNWVVEPVRKVVGTIRHDSNSEIALMSRDSLQADRDSLERMVVDFALDKPDYAAGTSTLSETQISDIRAKVREGDLSPILRAYEKDLRSPFVGTVRGDLVRTLLIQVQKTKVDVEVAMSGIDSLLKSQELVFGLVGLTPGILVSIGVAQYLRGLCGGRKGLSKSKTSGKCVRVLRNIDRIFSDAIPTPNNVLTYKDHGLLVCEVHVLRRLAHQLLPADVEKDFLEDLDDLANLKGIQSQLRALDRIRWAYMKWLA